MSRPFFSCVVPVKGERPYFDEALASLRAQGLAEDLEIIVQDADVEPDGGQSEALNRGLAKARGEWLFWLNADDVLLPQALAKVQSALGACSAADCRWLSGNLVYIDANSRVLKCVWERGWKWAYGGFPVRTYGPSSFFRRELFEQAGGLDPTCRFSMDTDLWCRFRELGHWHCKLPDYLWGFRIHAGSLTSGDLAGAPPPGMVEEQRRIDARYGLTRSGWRLRRLQLVRLLDGSYFRSYGDTRAARGRPWQEAFA